MTTQQLRHKKKKKKKKKIPPATLPPRTKNNEALRHLRLQAHINNHIYQSIAAKNEWNIYHSEKFRGKEQTTADQHVRDLFVVSSLRIPLLPLDE